MNNEKWKYDEHTRAVGPVSESDDQSYGMVIPVAFIDFNTDEIEQLRIANLVSAAPQMLNALQFIQPWLTSVDEEACHLVEEAIKKALK